MFSTLWNQDSSCTIRLKVSENSALRFTTIITKATLFEIHWIKSFQVATWGQVSLFRGSPSVSSPNFIFWEYTGRVAYWATEQVNNAETIIHSITVAPKHLKMFITSVSATLHVVHLRNFTKANYKYVLPFSFFH